MSNKSKIIAAAQKYAGKGNFEKAVAEYQKVLKIDPNDIRTWLKMGDLYTRMGARGEATDTYLKVAEQYRRSGFHLKAVAVYKQILKLDPLLTDVYELLGDAYLSLGLTSEALIQFEQLADIAARQNKPHILADTLGKILELDPNNISTRLRVAEQLSSVGEIRNAVMQFKTSCEQLKAQGRIDDYLKVAERLLYHDNTQIDIAREVAQRYLERQEPKRALAKLQVCFNANRRDVLTLEMLAAAFNMLKQPQKAISVYTELMNIAIEQNNIVQKHGYAKSILKLDPNHRVARRELGSNAAPSVTDMDEAQESELPSGPEAIVARLLDEADVLIKYGLVERATEHFDKIFAVDFYNLEARERFKDVLLENGNLEGAKEQLFILVDAFTESQPEGAVYYLHQILEIDPMSRRARNTLLDIGGVMPPGLPELPEEGDADEHSGLLVMEPVDMDAVPSADETASAGEFDISIADLPYVDDANLILEDSQIDIEPLDEAAEESEATATTPSLPPPSPADVVTPSLPPPSMPPAPPDMKSSTPPPLPRPPSIAPATRPRPPAQEVVVRPSQLSTGNEDETRPVPQITDGTDTIPPEMNLDHTAPQEMEADIDEELEEIEFFLEQGLVDEARGIYADLIATYPRDTRLLTLSSRFVEAKDISETGVLDDDLVVGEGDEPSTMEEISQELSSDLNLDEIAARQGEVAVDTVFSKFKEGVKKQISKSDYNTHFDLGQAYKEMGLWDDAIGEFKIASEDPERAATSELMVGMCHLGAGRFEEALETFEMALQLPNMTESEKLALLYEKAKVFELMELFEDALVIYRDILNVDPGFADVVDRIDMLE
ncbi:MAG: tetratricopeptide repeat protein [Deltaproteobacteria bacterium]|nr:tetratricopeptide repeat protein [Deltaproteobacteria bacterium]